jgi:CRISPR-associated protein Cas5d
MKPYKVKLEISGPTALWARPDTLPNPISYIAPTFSAVKGIFESVLRWKNVNVRPTRCEICAPVQFHDQMKKGASLQIFAQVLINVCYRLYAEVDGNRGPNGEPAVSPDGQCAPHAYVDAFSRKLESGRWFYTPCLGWKEFVPDYVGPFRYKDESYGYETESKEFMFPVSESENHVIPAFLETVFDRWNQRLGED